MKWLSKRRSLRTVVLFPTIFFFFSVNPPNVKSARLSKGHFLTIWSRPGLVYCIYICVVQSKSINPFNLILRDSCFASQIYLWKESSHVFLPEVTISLLYITLGMFSKGSLEIMNVLKINLWSEEFWETFRAHPCIPSSCLVRAPFKLESWLDRQKKLTQRNGSDIVRMNLSCLSFKKPKSVSSIVANMIVLSHQPRLRAFLILLKWLTQLLLLLFIKTVLVVEVRRKDQSVSSLLGLCWCCLSDC